MARPINADAARTRHSILEAASNLFAAHGYHATSVRQIANSAGLSLGMIRHYFGNKEGLYAACIESTYAIYGALGEEVQRGFAAGLPLDDVVVQAVRSGFRHAMDHRAACRLILWNLMKEPTWRSDLHERQMLPFILRVARFASGLTGRSVPDLAMSLRTMIFLIVRYATADHDELAFLLSGGGSGGADEHTAQGIEDHLADVARKLFQR